MRNFLNILTVFAVVISIADKANAQASNAGNCKDLSNADVRLACYDAVFGAPEPTTPSSPVEPEAETKHASNWIVRTDISALTDEKNVYASILSENSISGRFGGSGNGLIWLRCQENTTAVLFSFNENFMSDIQGYGRIEYRLGDEPMRQINTSSSTNNMSLGLWSGSRAIPFIKNMFDHNQMIIRATPYNESPITLTFEIAETEEAVEELREACHW